MVKPQILYSSILNISVVNIGRYDTSLKPILSEGVNEIVTLFFDLTETNIFF